MHTVPTITQPQQPAIPDSLEHFVKSALDGSNEFVNVGAAPDRDTAEREILAAVERRIGRRLTPHEAGNGVGMEVGLAWNARKQAHRAALADTQQALHAPLWGFR